ncbi:MAG: hypothetical protein D6693_10320 [Planctomycetota bacterium]|nr:MAG: hypothetical protein D6693_10320 [Planctomycetota bacterium]
MSRSSTSAIPSPAEPGAEGPPAPAGDPGESLPALAVTPATVRPGVDLPRRPVSPSKIDRIEAWVSRLSAKNRFWQRVCSLIWLPMAFRSGIRMKRVDRKTFTAVLPFRRFNRNWYNAMAGAALLANSEIAGGMYVFGVCGGDYECVCKRLEYRFLRPCFGPAVYKVSSRDDIDALVERGGEFNIDLVLDIVQQVRTPGSKERRVGRCYATFHATPKLHKKAKRDRKRRHIRPALDTERV